MYVQFHNLSSFDDGHICIFHVPSEPMDLPVMHNARCSFVGPVSLLLAGIRHCRLFQQNVISSPFKEAEPKKYWKNKEFVFKKGLDLFP